MIKLESAYNTRGLPCSIFEGIMNSGIVCNLCLFLIVVFVSSANAYEVDLSKNRKLNFDVPSDLTLSVDVENNEMSRSSLMIKKIDQTGREEFSLNLYIRKSDATMSASEQEGIAVLAKDCEYYAEGSIEKAVDIKKYEGELNVFYCSYTDASFNKENQNGDFKYILAAFSTNGAYKFHAGILLNKLGGIDQEVFIHIMETLVIRDET